MDYQMSSKYLSIQVIEENDLCISCGACTHICPFDNILMQYIDSRGKYDAVVQDDDFCLKCNGSKNCLAVCPSYNVNYEGLASSSQNDFFGKIENVYNGFSKKEETRYTSSSGGFIKSLGKELLDKNEINGIISITHDEGLDYTPKIITDVSLMPSSIYHNINFENAIELLKNNDGKYLLIGLPCQITSIEQLIEKRKYKYLKDRIYAKVALICGYTFERTNMEFFESVNNFLMEDISYRENGRYRKTRLTNNEESILFDVYNPKGINERINNNIMFDKMMPQKNCLFCVDHMGYCADIVVGDAWQQRYREGKIGTNIVVTRTILGDSIVKCLDSIYLEEGHSSELEESQHLYAKPFLGLSMAKRNLFQDKFTAKHLLSSEKIKFNSITFSFKDKLKIIFLKKILRKKNFKSVKLVYIFIEFKLVMKLIIKTILGRKI
jgi:coenzyme F420-reducing hydrogenase beta subunit